MIKYWKIGSRSDELSYFVAAPTRDAAVAVVEKLMGPQNPSQRLVQELPGAPRGFVIPEDEQPALLQEDPDAD